MQLHLGASVRCKDRPAGRLVALIADPAARTVTHLAVEPRHAPEAARLVPIARVASATPREIELDCTRADLEGLEPYHDIEWVPYALVLGWPPTSAEKPVVVDRIPPGEVEVRGDDRITADDGGVGRLEGLAVDADERQITGLLVEERHRLRHAHVVLPAELIERFRPGRILLHATRAEVAARERAASRSTTSA